MQIKITLGWWLVSPNGKQYGDLSKKIELGGLRDGKLGRVFTLHVADLGLISQPPSGVIPEALSPTGCEHQKQKGIELP